MRAALLNYLVLSLLTLALSACASSSSSAENDAAPAATQASYKRDGRNLAPGLQPYGADPLFPFGEYGIGGGGGRR